VTAGTVTGNNMKLKRVLVIHNASKMHKIVFNGLTMRSLPKNFWKNVGIPKMKIVPSLWAYLVINRIPAPIPGSLVSRLEAGLLTEVFSCRLPERQGFQ